MKESTNKPLKRFKNLLIGLIISLVLLSIIPVPTRIKDGGSIFYRPMIPVYSVTKWNGKNGENIGTAGITFTLFGMEIYNSFHEVNR